MRGVVAVVTAGVLALAGCGGGTEEVARPGAPAGAPMTIAISPKSGAKDVDPATEVRVAGTGGRLDEVRVTDTSGRELEGTYSPDHTSWSASVPVRVGTRYRVHAWGTSSGDQQVEETSGFATGEVQRTGTLEISDVLPADGARVGVGHPLIVTFNQTVADRATVQDALQVTTTPAVPGAWYWIDNVTVDYRPQGFWPAGTKVALRAKLAGIRAGNGVVGGKSTTSAFSVGRSQILQVDVDRHALDVVRDGTAIKHYEVSTGKQGWETRNGVTIIMAKQRHKTWTNEAIEAKEDYTYRSDYAMRVTNSGEFLHDAPWNTGNIGEANTSHGCIGLTPTSMTWLYEHTLVGDPVVVTGSPKPFDDLVNRIADWNVPWKKWRAGNA